MITGAAVVAICSVWMNRFLIIVPTLENPYIPIQDSRPEFIFYSPTWVEFSLSFAGIASIILLFALIMKFVPIIPIHEVIDDTHEPEVIKSKPMETQDTRTRQLV